MSSRLLGDLEARIARTRDPVRNACLRAERATVLARQGLLQEARAELDLIRARHAAAPDPVVTAWVCLGEGIVILYAELAARSRDKLLRAHALATACSDRKVRCLSAAWLAHLDYLDQNFDGMLEKVDLALSEAEQDDHLTRERVDLVVAQALHWCDRLDLARAWYERSRWHATSLGDDAFLSALMHNKAWLHVAQERRRSIQSQQPVSTPHLLLLGAEATHSFDALIGIGSLSSLVPLLQAHVLSLLDRHQEALDLFERHLGFGLMQGISRVECSALAEVAWCQARSGREYQARSTAEAAELKLPGCKQSDELAAAHGRLSQCYSILGDTPAAESHAGKSKALWVECGELQQTALTSLRGSQLIAPLLPKAPGR